MTKYTYEIIPNTAELGVGWTLQLCDEHGVIASGVFYLDRGNSDQLRAKRHAYEQAEKFALAWILEKRVFAAVRGVNAEVTN